LPQKSTLLQTNTVFFVKFQKKYILIFAYIKKKQYLWGIFIMGLLRPHENTLITRINLDTMNPFVRTIHSALSLLKSSKMVVVLLLIFIPTFTLANPAFPKSGSKQSTRIMGKQSYHAEPISYQMYNTSAYKVSTTLNPAQTIYTPFSDENPSSNSLGSIGGATASNGKDGFLNPGDPNKDEEHTESPLGDAWSLLIFAALAAGVIYIKRRKRTEVRD
jgi:hypothetical protein